MAASCQPLKIVPGQDVAIMVGYPATPLSLPYTVTVRSLHTAPGLRRHTAAPCMLLLLG
jgi:hypothetical protein